MVSVLITGGYGYLGARIAHYLLSQGHSVRLFGRKKPAPFLQGAETIEGNILDEKSVGEACSGMEAVIHLASANQEICGKDPPLGEKINVEGTRIVVEQAAKKNAEKLIFFSTFHVYGNARGIITEETDNSPHSSYAKTKLKAEALCKNQDLKCTIFRLSNVYGLPLFEQGWHLAIHDFCKQAILNGTVILRSTGEQKRDFIAASDVERATALILDNEQKKETEVYNLGGEKSLSIKEAADIVAEESSRLLDKKIISEFAANPAKEHNGNFSFSIEKLKKLGFAPTTDFTAEIKTILRNIKEAQ